MTPNAHIRQIIASEGAPYMVSVDEILSRRRDARIARARRDAVKAVHLALPRLSTTQLGEIFGRDSSTILWTLGGKRLVPMPPDRRRVCTEIRQSMEMAEKFGMAETAAALAGALDTARSETRA